MRGGERLDILEVEWIKQTDLDSEVPRTLKLDSRACVIKTGAGGIKRVMTFNKRKVRRESTAGVESKQQSYPLLQGQCFVCNLQANSSAPAGCPISGQSQHILSLGPGLRKLCKLKRLPYS